MCATNEYMPFSDAIQLNRMTSTFTRFDASPRREFPLHSKVFSSKPKQSVNISKETMAKVAREKLGNALQVKLAYNRFGAMQSSVDRVGMQLSAKA